MRFLLWISQHFVLGRIYPGFALWITMLRICGLRSRVSLWITGFALWITLAGLAVDYDASHLWISQPFGLGRIYPLVAVLWISGLGERWGLASPTPLRQD